MSGAAETWNPDAEPWEALWEADKRAGVRLPVRKSSEALAEALSEMGWVLHPLNSIEHLLERDLGEAMDRAEELEAEVKRLREGEDYQYLHHEEECAHGSTLMRLDRAEERVRELEAENNRLKIRTAPLERYAKIKNECHKLEAERASALELLGFDPGADLVAELKDRLRSDAGVIGGQNGCVERLNSRIRELEAEIERLRERASVPVSEGDGEVERLKAEADAAWRASSEKSERIYRLEEAIRKVKVALYFAETALLRADRQDQAAEVRKAWKSVEAALGSSPAPSPVEEREAECERCGGSGRIEVATLDGQHREEQDCLCRKLGAVPVGEPEAPKWRCCRCGRDITGHPQECPGCGWTVLEPVPPSPAPEIKPQQIVEDPSPPTDEDIEDSRRFYEGVRERGAAPEIKVGQRWDASSCFEHNRVRVEGLDDGVVTVSFLDDEGATREYYVDEFRRLYKPVPKRPPAPEIKVGQIWEGADHHRITILHRAPRSEDGWYIFHGTSQLSGSAAEWALRQDYKLVRDVPPAPSLDLEGLAWLDKEIADLRSQKVPMAWRGRNDWTARQVRLEALEQAREWLVKEAE